MLSNILQLGTFSSVLSVSFYYAFLGNRLPTASGLVFGAFATAFIIDACKKI